MSGIRYFFSYHAGRTERGSWAFGDIEATLPKPITTYADLQPIRDAIQQRNPGTTTVIILSWQRFEDPQ